MPKGRSKRRKDKSAGPTEPVSPDEDSESVCSSQDSGLVIEEGGGADDDITTTTEEDLEFKLAEYIDQLTDKNSRTRLEALSHTSKILGQKIVTQHLVGRKETVIDTLVRGVKRAHGKERCDLLHMAMLVAVQLGVEHPELLATLKPLLMQLSLDHTVAAIERAKCLHLLGVTTFIQAQDMLEVVQMMHVCEELFKKCKVECVLAAAVHSWSLLLSIAPTTVVMPLYQSLLPVFNVLLEKGDLSVRMEVGRAVALLCELAREEDEELLDSGDSQKAYDLIQDLATDSNRYTARKDRNQLRACFRDILQTLEDGTVPERSVKFGVEVLFLNNWAKLVQYDAFRELLGSGMNTHLQGNDLLREIFQLGAAPIATVESKAARLERKYYNAALAKYRTQSRGKQRDKRAVL